MVRFCFKIATLATLLFPLALSLPTASPPTPDASLNIIKFDKRSIPYATHGGLSKRKLDPSRKREIHNVTYSDHPVARAMSKRDADVPLAMIEDGVGWSAMVDVGTPAVQYPVLVDTGSSDLWIQSKNCVSAPCTATPKWIRADSSTAVDTGTSFSITYMDNTTVEAMNFRETVSWGGLTVTNQLIGVAQSMTSESDYPFGILGLGNPLLSYSVYFLAEQGGGVATTLWEHMVAENSISDLYSFVVGATSGQIVLGGIDWTKVYTDPSAGIDWSWNVMLGEEDFMITMTGMSINSVEIATNQPVYIDSGSTGIFVPVADLPAIYANVQNSFKYLSWAEGEVWAFPCSQTPPLEVFFGTQSYLIPTSVFGSLYTFQANNIAYCVGGIMGTTAIDGYWMLGDIFLQNVYTAVSMTNNSIGFAPYMDWDGITYS